MRVLLIEDLDALGADVGDARERAARLKAAGARVTWVAVARHGATISTRSAPTWQTPNRGPRGSRRRAPG